MSIPRQLGWRSGFGDGRPVVYKTPTRSRVPCSLRPALLASVSFFAVRFASQAKQVWTKAPLANGASRKANKRKGRGWGKEFSLIRLSASKIFHSASTTFFHLPSSRLHSGLRQDEKKVRASFIISDNTKLSELFAEIASLSRSLANESLSIFLAKISHSVFHSHATRLFSRRRFVGREAPRKIKMKFF